MLHVVAARRQRPDGGRHLGGPGHRFNMIFAVLQISNFSLAGISRLAPMRATSSTTLGVPACRRRGGCRLRGGGVVGLVERLCRAPAAAALSARLAVAIASMALNMVSRMCCASPSATTCAASTCRSQRDWIIAGLHDRPAAILQFPCRRRAMAALFAAPALHPDRQGDARGRRQSAACRHQGHRPGTDRPDRGLHRRWGSAGSPAS